MNSTNGKAADRGNRDAILAALDDLPPFPPVATRVLQLMDDPDASAADIARAISRDQAITAKVLRAGNSSFYGFAQQVTSLPQAVVVLGLRTVRDLVLLDSLPIQGRGGEMGVCERELWIHSVGTALAARFLAGRAPGVDSEVAFLGGLFHDVGRLLLNQFMPAAYDGLRREILLGRPWREAELERFGIDHTEVGHETFLRWELPGPIAEIARQHHEPPEGLSPVCLVVQAADELTHWERLLEPDEEADSGIEVEPPIPGPHPCRPGSAGELLGMNEAEMADLGERLRVALERESRFFLAAA